MRVCVCVCVHIPLTAGKLQGESAAGEGEAGGDKEAVLRVDPEQGAQEHCQQDVGKEKGVAAID